MVLFIIIILILILFYTVNNNLLNNEYFSNNEITFYRKKNLYNVLKEDKDNYFKSFFKKDLQVRNVNNINEYYEILNNSLCEPGENIINKITECISRIKLKISDYQLKNNVYNEINLTKFLNLKWNIGFVCNNEYENGLPHTRSDIIILNKNKIDFSSDIKIMKTLVHEQIHVYQKIYPEEVTNYLNNNEFKKIKIRDENDNIRANPDLDNYIYQDKNYNTYKAVYNNNSNSIEDITYYPYNEQSFEHPNEKMAIEFENILVN